MSHEKHIQKKTLNDYFLKQINKAGDIQLATAQAHKIKGASANVAGMALSALALKMELAGKSEDIEALIQHLAELEQKFSQLKAKIKETLS